MGQAVSGARWVDGGALRAGQVEGLAPAGAAVVVENADDGVDEIALLHLFNLLREQDGTLLLTGRRPPARWTIALPDLSSRLAAVPVVAILAPDDALLAAVVVKMFHDRQLAVDPGVIAYLLTRIERSFDAARQLVDRIDREALAARRRITIPFVKGVLGNHP